MANVARSQEAKHSLPRPLGSVGGNQNVGAAERIESPMGDVIKYVLHYRQIIDQESTLRGRGKGSISRKNPPPSLGPRRPVSVAGGVDAGSPE